MRSFIFRICPILVVMFALWVATFVHGQENMQSIPVAPSLLEPMDPSSQRYLIGVVSFVVFTVTAILGVGALMKVDYSDDSLLMVEVPESVGGE